MRKRKVLQTDNFNDIFPIKVRLSRFNGFNKDKVKINNIELFTYKYVVINDYDTFDKLRPIQNQLIVDYKLKELKSEDSEKDDVFA